MGFERRCIRRDSRTALRVDDLEDRLLDLGSVRGATGTDRDAHEHAGEDHAVVRQLLAESLREGFLGLGAFLGPFVRGGDIPRRPTAVVVPGTEGADERMPVDSSLLEDDPLVREHADLVGGREVENDRLGIIETSTEFNGIRPDERPLDGIPDCHRRFGEGISGGIEFVPDSIVEVGIDMLNGARIARLRQLAEDLDHELHGDLGVAGDAQELGSRLLRRTIAGDCPALECQTECRHDSEDKPEFPHDAYPSIMPRKAVDDSEPYYLLL